MATTNKAITTYLPDESVEWIETHFLQYPQLLNKEGKVRIGTAIAFLVESAKNGDVILPESSRSVESITMTEVRELIESTVSSKVLNLESTVLELKVELSEIKKPLAVAV